MLAEQQVVQAKAEKQSIKCVVWDLDNTLWEGILLEDDAITLRPGVREVLQELDRRGILNSIASRNDADLALSQLEALGLKEYFLYPEINWNAKSASVEAISKALNIGLDTFAFIDDQPFEREEVAFVHPQVLCVDAADLEQLLDLPRMKPRFITAESQLRRQMYQGDIVRAQAEAEFTGSNEEFLAKLQMVFTIKMAEESDLKRAEELTVRTHQLNTTGYTYSYDELDRFRQSADHLLLVASLDDKFGTYGTIGLALVEKGQAAWLVKLLLMSCRVMSRGVGTIMMSYIMSKARQANVPLRAHFIPNGRNRMMYVTYKFGGFKEVEKDGDLVILENAGTAASTGSSGVGADGGVVVESVSANHIFAGASDCGPTEVKILAHASAPQGIEVVVLFFRFEPGSGAAYENVVMKPVGGDLYEATLNMRSILRRSVPFDLAKLNYQIVVQQKDGDTSIRTPVLTDVEVEACGNAAIACSSYNNQPACEAHGCRWVMLPGILPVFKCGNQ